MPNIPIINRPPDHSDEIQDIISRSPRWLLRKSMWFTCVFVAIIIISTYFIKYPEILRVPVTLTGASPSVIVKAGNSGLLLSLYVGNGEHVKQGDLIMQIESAADWKDIQVVTAQLNLIINYTLDKKVTYNLPSPENIRLGELKPFYTSLFLQMMAYEMSLNTNVAINRYEEVLKKAKELKSEIDTWESKNIVRSPITGKVVFTKPLKNRQFINQNEVLFSVIPNDYEPMVFSKLSGDFVGRIHIGDIASINLKEYPYREFGMVKVEIKSIIPLSEEGLYIIEYKLLNGLKTSRNFRLPELLNVSAQADIILSNNSILYNIFKKR